MKNFEFYKDEILKMCREGDGVRVFALANPNKLYKHNGNPCCSCSCELLEWLYSEHVEKPKLNKYEKNFLELLGTGWIAKDQNLGLYMYAERPVKTYTTWDSKFGADINFNKIRKFNPQIKFDFIKWEDEEPWSVEELLKLEVEE